MQNQSADRSVCVRSCGKINLSLGVIRRRRDGFHDIVSWMQPIDWADTLVVRATDREGVSLRCTGGTAPSGRENLAYRAAEAFARWTGHRMGLEIELQKDLPVGGGLGGGSGNAAAVLVALARLRGIAPNEPRLVQAAADLGSDVPFFLTDGAVVARGRGEILESVPSPFIGWAVLIVPPFGVATRDVFAACTPSGDKLGQPAVAVAGWSDAASLSEHLHNDLFEPACRVEPRLAELHRAVEGRNGVRVHMSGSGSTLFALFDDRDAAARWSELVRDAVRKAELRIVRVLDEPPCRVTAAPA